MLHRSIDWKQDCPPLFSWPTWQRFTDRDQKWSKSLWSSWSSNHLLLPCSVHNWEMQIRLLWQALITKHKYTKAMSEDVNILRFPPASPDQAQPAQESCSESPILNISLRRSENATVSLCHQLGKWKWLNVSLASHPLSQRVHHLVLLSQKSCPPLLLVRTQ